MTIWSAYRRAPRKRASKVSVVQRLGLEPLGERIPLAADLLHSTGVSSAFSPDEPSAQLAVDGDYATKWERAFESHGGGGDIRLQILASFSTPIIVNSFEFRMSVYASIDGTTDRFMSGEYRIETLLADGVWHEVPGGAAGFGEGGTATRQIDSGIATLQNLDLNEVHAVRAYVHVNAFANNRKTIGTAVGHAAIHEFQAYGLNGAPVAANDLYITAEDTPLDVPQSGPLSNDLDPEADVLSASVVSGPVNGTLVLNENGAFIYTPNPNYNGIDSFTYVASDGSLTSNIATVIITIDPVNDAPQHVLPNSQTTARNRALEFSAAEGNGISIADVDAGTSVMEVTLTVSNGTLTLDTTSGLTFIVGNGANDATMTFRGTMASINTALDGLVYRPRGNFTGRATLSLSTSDLGNTGSGGSLTTTDTLAIDVLPPAPRGPFQALSRLGLLSLRPRDVSSFFSFGRVETWRSLLLAFWSP
jgi:hypothetical protein